MSSSTAQSAVMRDGAALRYRLIEGDGPARFALVHSLAMDRHFWEPVAERLLDLGSVLLFDCRGHGESAGTGAPFTIEQFADDLADLFGVVGWSDAIVAGASMGGCVSIAFAVGHPDKVRGLGLVDTTASYGDDAIGPWEERAQKALAGGLASLVPFQKSRWFSEGWAAANPATVQQAVDVFLANDLDAYAETCRLLGRADKRADLPAITAPTRILVGSEDYATPPAMAGAMAAAIPGATMAVLDGAAHLTPIERPEEVAAMLRELAEAAA